MKFLKPELEMEFGALHPSTRGLAEDLDAWSLENGVPEVVVTHVLRTADDSERLYLPMYLKLGYTPEEARRRARARFSWHLVGCAVDLRNSHYTAVQRKQVMQYLRQHCPSGTCELLEHDIGRGNHIHLAFKDEQWRLTYPKHEHERSTG